MALTQATLKAELLDHVVPGTDPAVAKVNLADAFTAFAAEATLNGASAVPAVLQTAPHAAFVAALTGWEVTGAAPPLIQTAVIAFWTAAFTTAVAVWAPPVPSTAVFGPPFVISPATAAIAVGITALPATDDRDAAMDALATVLYTGSLGSTVSVTIAPAPPVVTPVL